MFYAFSDYENLFLVTELVTGGDMRYHLSKRKKFCEQKTKFFMEQAWSTHRDIKPENLLLGEKGYVHITDMGISRIWSPDKAHDTSGTPGYMAPEVMYKQNHGVAVDYFALGNATSSCLENVRNRERLGKRSEIRYFNSSSN